MTNDRDPRAGHCFPGHLHAIETHANGDGVARYRRNRIVNDLVDAACRGERLTTDPAVVRCQFFLDLLREGVVRVGDGPVSPTIEDAISSLCRATDERDPLRTRRAIRDAGRTYAHEVMRSSPSEQDAVVPPWKQKRVFVSAIAAPSEPADEVDP